MSGVRIPPVLRTATGGQKQVTVPGGTVGEVIDALVATYPALGAQLVGPTGGLNPFVNVFLNDTDIRHLEERATAVQPSDTLIILPAMAGGSLR